MFSLKRGTDEDVDSLIESMLRLIEYMNQNPAFKRDIFKSFSTEDLNKILKNMEDTNIKLRKVSSLFLCSILTNSENCDKFCSMLDLLPISGKLSVTPIPDRMVKILTQKPRLLNQINQAFLPSMKGESPFCWYYTIQMARDGLAKVNCFYASQLKDIKNFFYEFADPAESLIGVIYAPSQTILTSITNTQVQSFQLSTAREQQTSSSPQNDSLRKSVESYRPNSVQIPQQSLIKSRYGPIITEPIRKLAENGLTNHSPQVRQSPSPQQQFSINVKPKTQQQKTQSSTPVSSYTTFLNAQRLKIDNNRYTSDKQKNQVQGQKNNQFDFLRHRLSDNMQIQQQNKSSLHQNTNTTALSASQNYPISNKMKTQAVANSSFSPQQDWRSSGNRLGVGTTIPIKNNVGKVRNN